VPEADAVARALSATATDLDGFVRRERHFAVHASHELRTPLTAARLELEELSLSSSTPPDVVARVSAAMSQLDRLAANVGGMLDATRDSILGSRVDIDLAALVRDTAAGWAPLAHGRPIRTRCDGVVAVRLPVGSLMQVMDVVIGNAVTHGEGAIDVSIIEAPAYVEVEVADQGSHDVAVEGAKTRLAAGHGSLAIATRIASALGGQLRLTDAPATTFSLVLPRSPRETVDA
jgi:signal transduction histidine kinase